MIRMSTYIWIPLLNGDAMSFAVREMQARERMEDPRADPQRMANTYAQFRHVNRLVSGWRWLYRHKLRPHLVAGRRTTVLDIGFGGGDVVAALARWAERDGLDVEITAIDSDRRAYEWVSGRQWPASLTFRHGRAEDLLAAGQRFDWVISNHLLHHLSDDELNGFLVASEGLAERVLHCDLVRSRRAYALFRFFVAPLFRRSFIAEDGLLSVRRSYTVEELRRRAPEGWTVEAVFPFHQLLARPAHGEKAG